MKIGHTLVSYVTQKRTLVILSHSVSDKVLKNQTWATLDDRYIFERKDWNVHLEKCQKNFKALKIMTLPTYLSNYFTQVVPIMLKSQSVKLELT